MFADSSNLYLMPTLKKIAIVAILSVVVTLIINSAYIARADAPVLTKQQIYQEKLNQWIDKLEMAESNDDPKLNYFDVNSRYSRGCLQFQDATWKTETKKFSISGSQFDCSTERQVAILMIQNNYSSWRNWWNSTHEIGLPPRS